jgi:hypothetical protein
VRTPQLNSLRSAVAVFLGPTGTEQNAILVLAEGGIFDATRPSHSLALLTWLNSWGCRIPYPTEGETDLFGSGLRQWWADHGTFLPDPSVTLSELRNADIDRLRAGFVDLTAMPVGAAHRPRRMGPTAASKTLYALRPRACMPWDDAIARHLHGGRDDEAYAAHLRLGRRWARDLRRKTGLDEAALSAALGSPGRPLTKIFDDYCYLRFTRGLRLPSRTG